MDDKFSPEWLHIQRAHCSPSLSIVKQPERVVWYNPFVSHEITIKITLKSSCPFVNSSKLWFFREESHYISLIYIILYIIYLWLQSIHIYIYIIYNMNPWAAITGLPYPSWNHWGTSRLLGMASECPCWHPPAREDHVNGIIKAWIEKKNVVLPRVNNISAIKSNLESFGSETPNLENNGDVQLKT